jgi:ribosomal 50S subunit-recycling heat shock protein
MSTYYCGPIIYGVYTRFLADTQLEAGWIENNGSCTKVRSVKKTSQIYGKIMIKFSSKYKAITMKVEGSKEMNETHKNLQLNKQPESLSRGWLSQ